MPFKSDTPRKKLPASRLPGLDEELYQDYLHKECIWWPWWVAGEFYWRKTRHVASSTQLIPLANKYEGKGDKQVLLTFIAGAKGRAPTRLRPVDKDTFMNWVQGGKKRKAKPGEQASVETPA